MVMRILFSFVYSLLVYFFLEPISFLKNFEPYEPSTHKNIQHFALKFLARVYNTTPFWYLELIFLYEAFTLMRPLLLPSNPFMKTSISGSFRRCKFTK